MDSVETETLDEMPSPQAQKSSSAARASEEELSRFVARHIGPNDDEISAMLSAVGFESLDRFIDATVPKDIRLTTALDLPAGKSEQEALAELRKLSEQNKVVRNFIGAGYSDCVIPPVIQRNILENPGWYTAYTPYQAEIAQGRLEALLNFQTMITDLTALDIANASLLDEATAAAEAMTLCHAVVSGRDTFFVSDKCHPQTIEVVQTRAQPLGIRGHRRRSRDISVQRQDLWRAAAISDHRRRDHRLRAFHQVCARRRRARDRRGRSSRAHSPAAAGRIGRRRRRRQHATFRRSAGLRRTARRLFRHARRLQAPHAGTIGRRVARCRRAPRLSARAADARAAHPPRQSDEQHLHGAGAARRHGLDVCRLSRAGRPAQNRPPHPWPDLPPGRWHRAARLRPRARAISSTPSGSTLGQRASDEFLRRGLQRNCNLRALGPHSVGISLDETTTPEDIEILLGIFGENRAVLPGAAPANRESRIANRESRIPHPPGLQHASHRDRDAALPAPARVARSLALPLDDSARLLHDEVERDGGDVSGFLAGVCAGSIRLRPTIRRPATARCASSSRAGWPRSPGSPPSRCSRTPARRANTPACSSSAHITRRAAKRIATSASSRPPPTAPIRPARSWPVSTSCPCAVSKTATSISPICAPRRTRTATISPRLMVTYPSTHGVFETTIREICEIVHAHGGQVYMDGANMNAQVGLCRPGDIGADVCHLNLHKTFCIPHGGGGPGVGPIGVAATSGRVSSRPSDAHAIRNRQSATPHRPRRRRALRQRQHSDHFVDVHRDDGRRWTNRSDRRSRSSTPTTSRNGSTRIFPSSSTASNGLVAHECILDLRPCKSAGVEVEDVAKRLMDYGFHAPTVSWPVARHDDDRADRERIESRARSFLRRDDFHPRPRSKRFASGQADPKNNVLKNAPHTAEQVTADTWDHPYSREQAAYPATWTREQKFWPAVARIDSVYGDRNLFCTCPPMEEFAE